VGVGEPSAVINGKNSITFHIPERHGLMIPYNKFRDACSKPRWVVNDVSLDTSLSMPFDTPTSSRLGNGFESLIQKFDFRLKNCKHQN
jgi:hypothetical protein